MPETILVVDDHAAMRDVLRTWFNLVLPQHQIIEADSAEDAYRLALRNKPALLITDITLPGGMNGIELTRWVKSVMPNVAVVILTIHDDKIHRADALNAGADAYVTKAHMEKDLLPTVKAALEPCQEHAQEYIATSFSNATKNRALPVENMN